MVDAGPAEAVVVGWHRTFDFERLHRASSAIRASRAPVVAVSPFVGGRAIKGPTEPFMEFAGLERSAAGIVAAYGDTLDGLVSDEPLHGAAIPVVVEDTLMDGAEARRRVADATLQLASRRRRS